MKHQFAKWITLLMVGVLVLALLTACGEEYPTVGTQDETETTGHDCVKDGHIEVIDKTVAPTCTEPGLTEGKHCSVCLEILVKQETIAKLSHQYDENDLCTNCNAHRPSEGLEYTLLDDTCYEVSGIGTCTDIEIYIPSEYNGLPVTSIGYQVFYNCSRLTSMAMGNSVTSIGESAFYDCHNLISITFDGTTEQWKAIEKADYLRNCVVTCTDGKTSY